MNRPRNRQPRPDRGGRGGNNNSSRGQSTLRGRGGANNPRGSHNNHNPRPAYTSVPGVDKVLPGTSVSIVLKQDQPTGREVQGVVQDLLTRGNHPRGIKVRLSDGRVGRVQRMVGDGTTVPAPKVGGSQAGSSRERGEDDANEGPPTRTLADYIQFPSDGEETESAPRSDEVGFTTATAKCPVCGLFEGDEIAVSRHAEEHFT